MITAYFKRKMLEFYIDKNILFLFHVLQINKLKLLKIINLNLLKIIIRSQLMLPAA